MGVDIEFGTSINLPTKRFPVTSPPTPNVVGYLADIWQTGAHEPTLNVLKWNGTDMGNFHCFNT